MNMIVESISLMIVSLFILYPLSKYLTIGDKLWINDMIYKIEREGLRESLLRLSYFKLFICRPCITFWLTLITIWLLVGPLLSIPQSLLTYLIIKRYEPDVEEDE